MENNAQLQKLFLSTRPETGFIFHLYRDILWISPAENICFASSRKKYRGPETGLMPGSKENNKLYHVSNHLSSDLYFYKLK